MTERYVELRAASAFSFLRSTVPPASLAQRAAELGYRHLALADADGLYGAPQFWGAAKEHGLRPLVGIDLGLEQFAEGAPGRLLLLARNPVGYQKLCRLATLAHARGPENVGVSWVDLEVCNEGLTALTGGYSGILTRALEGGDDERAGQLAERLCAIFGREHVLGELQRHGDPRQERLNRRTLDLAAAHGLRVVASNGVRMLEPKDRALLDVLTCIRRKVTLDSAGTLLARNDAQQLKSPAAMAERFADLPEVLAATAAVAAECEYTLDELPYEFPNFAPPGVSEAALLHERVEAGARKFYRPMTPAVRAQLDRELALIVKLGLSGYFLIVADIIEFCERHGILAKGRGSAANSAVCYALNITTVDPVASHLLFERFLSEERGEWPDIDIDLPSGDEREKVIQYVFSTYGPRRAAMCAEVITYRDRSAVREVGKALGFGPQDVERLSQGDALVRGHPRGSRWPAADGGAIAGGPAREAVAGDLRAHPEPAAPPLAALGGHDHLGRSSGRGRAHPARAHAGADRHPVGQGRRRGDGAHQDRPARPGDAGGAARGSAVGART